jgi:arylsulfatase A-like enzyme
MTRRAMDFISEAETDGRPWCLHLSYIKPHWPYIAPEPLRQHVRRRDVMPGDPLGEGAPGSASGVSPPTWTCATPATCRATRPRKKVIPTYMGLIKQIDDQMGVLMAILEERAASRHHHDRVHVGSWRLSRRPLDGREGSVPRSIRQRFPLIVIDPSREAGRDPRHRSRMRWSKAIDLAPTFIEYFGGTPPDHILEGRS